MEGWNNLLGGVGDITPIGTKSEVYAARNVKLAELPLLIQYGATTRAAYIHHRKLWVLVCESVTIHTTIL